MGLFVKVNCQYVFVIEDSLLLLMSCLPTVIVCVCIELYIVSGTVQLRRYVYLFS